MKKSILAVITFILLAVSTPVSAEANTSVGFEWLQAPSIEWGTKVYIGTEPGNYTNSEDAGINTTGFTLENLEYNTTYYFTATHYDPTAGLESPYADEISWTSPGPDVILFAPLDRKKEHPLKSYIIRFLFK